MNPEEPAKPQVAAPSARTFSFNSPEARAALCRRSDAWVPNGALPRDPRPSRFPAPLHVAADNDSDAEYAVQSWLRHVEAMRIAQDAEARTDEGETDKA